jgi:hypothetical protein
MGNKGNINTTNHIYIDKLGNVILESSFTLVLGKVDSYYRFIPKSSLVIEQGLTTQMLMVIAELIKEEYTLELKK